MGNYSEARTFAEEVGLNWWNWKNISNILLGTAISLPFVTSIPIIGFITIVLTESVSKGEFWSIVLSVIILAMVIIEKTIIIIGICVLCIREYIDSKE